MERERLLIDTTILIDHLRQPQKHKTLFYQLAFHCDYLISVVTEFEFSIGMTMSNRSFVEQLLAQLPTLPFDAICSKTAVAIYQALKAKNQLIPAPDIFIAATAMAHGLPLLTLNRKHFERIDSLQLYAP